LIRSVVMRGLDPRIHHLRKIYAKKMDPRVKPAGDGWMDERRLESTGNRYSDPLPHFGPATQWSMVVQ